MTETEIELVRIYNKICKIKDECKQEFVNNTDRTLRSAKI